MRKSVLGAALAALITSSSVDAQDNRWGANYFPNLPVVTQDGKTLKFYDDLIRGKRVVVSFIYTSCPDICPLTTALLAQVQDELGSVAGRDVQFISITVDPEHDTPAKMKAFANAYHAGPGWYFLTGKPQDVRAITRALGDRSQALYEHRNEIVLGNDATGEWARDSLFGEIGQVVTDIRAMDPKWRDQVRTPQYNAASDTGYVLSSEPGQALYKRMCAACHTIGVGDRVGPDLRDVTKRRSKAWLTSFISRPDQMFAKKDPTALALAARFPAVRMPRLGVAETDAADLIHYIESRTASLDAGDSIVSAADHSQHAMPPSGGMDHSQHVMPPAPGMDHSQHIMPPAQGMDAKKR